MLLAKTEDSEDKEALLSGGLGAGKAEQPSAEHQAAEERLSGRGRGLVGAVCEGAGPVSVCADIHL